MKLHICVLTIAITAGLSAAHKAVERVGKAAEVLNEVMGTREKAIPSDLLSKGMAFCRVGQHVVANFIHTSHRAKGRRLG